MKKKQNKKPFLNFKEKKRFIYDLSSRGKKISRILSNFFEELFAVNRYTIILTLVLSIGLVYSVKSFNNLTLTRQVTHTVKEQLVTATYDKNKYVVEGIPEVADITFFGDEGAIQATKTYNNYIVSLDLEGLAAGNHVVDLVVDNLPQNVSAQTNPNKVQVSIHPKDFQEFPVKPEIINAQAVTGTIIQNPQLVAQTVTLNGAKKDLEQVAFVQALIDGKIIQSSITSSDAQKFSGKANIAAYDENGVKLENITSELEGIDYTIDLVKPSAKAIQKINVVFSGNFPEGKAIKNYTLGTDIVTINGSQDAIEKVDELNLIVDLKDIKTDGKITGDIQTPANVVLNNITPLKIDVNLEFGDAKTKLVPIQSVNPINGQENYTYSLENGQDAKQLAVEVIGTDEQLAILNNQRIEDVIKAEVDVRGLGVGTHTVPIKIKSSTMFRYKLTTTEVKIKIAEKN